MNDTAIAIDIAKSVFELAVSRHPGRVDERKRLVRSHLLPYLANVERCVIVMEACGTAHHWAREFEKVGHVVVLLPPHMVRPYVRRNKTDRTDAKGILEAYRNKDIKAVPVKTPEQQAVGALHRMRSGWIKDRTARLNTLRGLCREVGFAIPLGAEKVIPAVREFIGDADRELARPFRLVLSEACDEIREIERRIDVVDGELHKLARELPWVKSWMTIPGIGEITATALFAFVGDMRRFPNGREFASHVGLTPRENSSGLRRHLGRISKRGDVYLRTLMIHGARAVLNAAKRSTAREPDRLRAWALDLDGRVGHNKAAVALANKLARIAWAVATRNDVFRSVPRLRTTAA